MSNYRNPLGNAYSVDVPAPKPPTSPIYAELVELKSALEALEKRHLELAEQLRPVCVNDTANNKPADGIASEPSTGCELKDRIAELKQHVLYITRLNNQLTDRLYV